MMARRPWWFTTLIVVLLLSGIALATQEYDAYDDDHESVVTEKASVDPSAQEAMNAPLLDASSVMQSFRLENFYTEIVVLAMFAFYLVNYLVGRNRNNEIAKAWTQANHQLMDSNFSYVGDGKGHVLIKDSQSDYIFYASGRVNCRSLTTKLTLKHRHELVAYMLEVMNGQADRVQIELLLTPRCLDNYIIALFPKKLAVAARKDYYDIATFTKPMSHAQLTDRLVLLTDCPEAVDALFTPNVIAIINHFAPYIQKIHITDQWIYKPTAAQQATDAPHTMTFTFKLPDTTGEFAEHVALQELALYLVDAAAGFTLRRDAKQRSEKARLQATEVLLRESHHERQEAAQQRKAEKLRKEIEKMTPEQRAKWEEKQKEKERRKRAVMVR